MHTVPLQYADGTHSRSAAHAVGQASGAWLAVALHDCDGKFPQLMVIAAPHALSSEALTEPQMFCVQVLSRRCPWHAVAGASQAAATP